MVGAGPQDAALQAEGHVLSGKAIRGLEVRYALAILVILALLSAGWVVKDTRTHRSLAYASLINEAGRQRMLSQRFLYLVNREDARSERISGQLAAIIDRFASAHSMLLARASGVPEIAPAYLQGGGAPSLDESARAFVRAGRAAIANPGDAETLVELKALADGPLLVQLDKAVSAFEAHAEAEAQGLLLIEHLSFLAAILTILVEAIFIFLPGHRTLKSALWRVEEKKSALERTADELWQTSTALEATLAESERLRQEQHDFTYAVSHDLKSPTNTVEMVLSELEADISESLDAETRELFQIAHGATRRMGDLVEGVLNFGKVSNSEMACEWVDTGALFAEVTNDLSAAISAAGAEVSAGALDPIWGQPLQIRMLIQNLVANAVKFRDPGRAPVVRVAAVKGLDGAVMIHCRDNGISIPPEARDKVLKLFNRLHTRKAYDGSGIGLTLCDRIARNHGGAIRFQDHDGPGITVVAELRLQPETDAAGQDRIAKDAA